MKNEFYEVMKVLTDDELIKRYLNQSDYTSEAIIAMEMVLKERDMDKEIQSLMNQKHVSESITKEEEYELFQISEFGKLVSDEDYAKERLNNSQYLSKRLSPLHNYGWLFSLFIIFGIVGALFTISILAIGEFKNPFNTILIIGSLFGLLLPIGIWKKIANSAQLNVVNLGRRNFIEIKSGKDNFELPFPLNVKFYWRWVHIKLNLKQVELVLLIFDEAGNTVVEIDELQVLLKPVPLGWDELPSNIASELKGKKVYGYSNYGAQKPFLVELHKIINGL